MPGTMLRTTWGQVDATSLSDFGKILTDNITGRQVILWMLGQLGGIETRTGKTIAEPIMLDTNPSVQWYSGSQPFNMTKGENATVAEYPWSQLGGVAQLDGIEIGQNQGSNGFIDLMNAAGENLATSMRIAVNTALPSDGSADGGNALVGLLSAVENGDSYTTYGTINSATSTNWQNQFVDVANYTTSTNFMDGMRQLIYQCQGGLDRPHLNVMTDTLFLYFLSKLEAKEQIIRASYDEDMGRAGFYNAVYMGVPCVGDPNMLPNTTGDDAQGMVTLNLDYAKFVMMRGYEFKFTDWMSPNNQDVESMKCLLYCQFILSNRRRQGRADFATT